MINVLENYIENNGKIEKSKEIIENINIQPKDN